MVMIKILNAQGRREERNLIDTHLFDDEEKRTITGIVPGYYKWTQKAE